MSLPTPPLEVNVKLGSQFSAINEHTKNGIHVYRTTSCNRGLVKIINIFSTPGLVPRSGSQVDVANLKSLFQQMGLSVDVHPARENTKTGIETALETFVNDDQLLNADMIILFIMGFGTKDYYYTADQKKIYYADVRDYFSEDRCEKMQTKPKMIFFQVIKKDIDELMQGVETDDMIRFDGISRSIPVFTDLLVAYSIGVSFVCPYVGSRSIFLLCEELMKWACKLDVVTVLQNLFNNMNNKLPAVYNEYWTYKKSNFGMCYLNPGVCLDDAGKQKWIFEEKKIKPAKKQSKSFFSAKGGPGGAGGSKGGGGGGGGTFINQQYNY